MNLHLDDTIAAHPSDTIIYGSGTPTFLSNAPYLDVIAGPNQTVNEGQSVTLSSSFIDPDDADTHKLTAAGLRKVGRIFVPGHAIGMR